MTIASTSTDPCGRNGGGDGGDACPISYAISPPTKPFYAPANYGYCIACNQINKQLRAKGILAHNNVGNVSKPVFNRGIARVRALQFQPYSPSDIDGYYLPLVKEVLDFALRPKVNDTSFETEIENILALYVPPINAAQDDEEQEGEEQEGEEQEVEQHEVVDQEEEGQDEEQEADGRNEAQGFEQGPVHAHLQVLLNEMKTITNRQADDASRMLELIAEVESLSIAR